MNAGADIDRNEPATTYKLDQARSEGQVARSPELTSCLVFVAALVFMTWHGMGAWRSLLRIGRSALVELDSRNPAALWPLVAHLAEATFAVLLPLFAVLLVAAVAGSVCQTGFVFSLAPLKPDFARLNPATGLKRLFSLRTVVDGVRASVKLALLAASAAIALWTLFPTFAHLGALDPAAFVRSALDEVLQLAWRMAAVLALIAAADVLYTRHEFKRRMRMSRREVKDEYRHREGDPRIRSRLRELRRELLKRSKALRNTSSADVVLTNPTHFAVALRYVHGEMDAPRVVAKGAGHLAAAMREIAARHRVVVVQNPQLTRRLFRATAIDDLLPAEFHSEVARIIVWVLAARQARQNASAGVAA